MPNPSNLFTYETLKTIDDLRISETIDTNTKTGMVRFHLNHISNKNIKKYGFYYQLNGKIKSPFGFSNYQNSGNISTEFNIPTDSPDFSVLSDIMEVMKRHITNRPDLRLKYLKYSKDWNENIFDDFYVKKNLIHYSKNSDGTFKFEYDPSMSVTIPFGFEKGSKGPVTDSKNTGIVLSDSRIKIPYFNLLDHEKNPIKCTIENICSIVPPKSELLCVVLKFDRINFMNGKFNIYVEFVNGIILPRENLERTRFFIKESDEKELQKAKEFASSHSKCEENNQVESTKQIYEEDEDEVEIVEDDN